MSRFSPGLQSAIDNLIAGRGTPLRTNYGARSNPGMRTIQAKRPGTCPISDEAIEVGDSITKTPAGWALTEHVQSFMENPLQIKSGKGKFKQPASSIASRKVDYAHLSDAELRARAASGDARAAEHLEENEMAYQEWHARQTESRENPSMGGRAMKYAKAHGVSLKEGWAAVKSGLSNPYYENPSMGGAAMKYARAHGVSLKQGWAAVKAGRS